MSTRFVFVEGIMGAGKTTTCEFIAEDLARRGLSVRALSEGGEDHTLRIALEFPHPNAVWRDTTPADFAARSIHAWQSFVAEADYSATVTVCDGLLFHGNLTDLMMMNVETSALHQYAAEILATLAPLSPAVLYLRQPDIAQALRAISAIRGPAWERYQINWKMSSPYAQAQGLHGFDGLAQLYMTYRALCDDIFATLAVPKLCLNPADDWPGAYSSIRTWLADILPPAF